MGMLRAVWDYRHFIAFSVLRELQSRYRGSLAGAAWLVVQPLATIAIYAAVFSSLMRLAPLGVDSVFGYALFICAGLLTWNFFTEIVSRSVTIFVENGNLLKKSRFPRSTLPIIVAGTSTANFGVVAVLFLVILAATGRFPGPEAWLALPVLALQTVFAVALGVMLGTLNVFFRDVAQATPTVLQFWFWLTPVIYPVSMLPEWLQRLILLNPMTPIMTAYQRLFFAGEHPDWASLGAVALVTLLLVTFAVALFRSKVGEMADEL
jgi:lipopolysaccharide transport system permease protein